MRLTFKRQPKATGLAAVGEPYPSVDIKADGKCVGWIAPPGRFNKWTRWTIWFHVRRANEDNFDNKKLKAEFDDEAAARAHIKEHWVNIEKLGLYQID